MRRILLSSLVLLTACATPPPAQPPKVELPVAWKETAPRFAEDGRWWRIYEDQELDKLVEEAFARNTDLLIAAARVDEARALVADARGAQMPTVDARFAAQRQQNSKATATFFPGIPTQYSDYRAALNVSWELDVFGRLRSAASAAAADFQASEAARDGVRLALAAQYERWSLPLSVLLALPFGTFGALAAVNLTGHTNDVYFQIGLVTLLGLAAKNAILIVQFAELKEREGLSPAAAALEAARLRFRPILMTSLAFIFGVLPLALSTGAGAGARRSVGTGVMGGMLAATFLAIFFVPMFFKLLATRRLRESRSTAEIRAEVERSHTVTHQQSLPPHHAPHTSQ